MRSWWTWCPTSQGALQNAEARILSFIKTKFEDTTVQISNNNKINTVCINTEMGKRHIPLVMMHGFGSGIALWVRNLDSLSKSRPLYCFDLLGFGRSSRPRLSNKAEIVEAQFVESVEEWRKAVGLNSFILLGHSLGGYLAAAYALRYPSRVKQLILADPWGFPQRPTTSDLSRRPRVPVWIRAIVFLMQPFNPLAILRAAGPWGMPAHAFVSVLV
ncbi:PREDICTED: 1-acylglycerol-3-phosphate O-acyltransferase ABHD5-like [Priapulus caudatus]|uniref:1-acylglycerol-3-phosphate O-acyltransferase ABHD5-like n=1 Tax=Priapulus caudatus TaxID=37621 RepID=A0ABM1EI85_PRICU|nr:PREDICTED: 1-acylglycerol-3-phosphate O-acyltransferase ABHD5-like [Priapulus caudatus]